MGHDARRAGDVALVLLAAAVVVGCLGLGAPPRMDAIESAPAWMPAWMPSALEALLPLAVVQILVLLAAARLAASGVLLGFPGGRAPFVALLGLATLGVLQLALGATAWTYGSWTALAQVAGLLVASAAALVAVRHGGAGRARAVLAFVAIVAALECVYGVAATHLGDDTVVGFAKVSSLGRVTGTFVMPSVLATLGAMGACCALALAVDAHVRGRRGLSAAWALALAACGAGVVLSLGRWMVVAAAAGLVVAMWTVGGVLRRDGRRGAGSALRAAAALVPAAGAAAGLLVPALRERFAFLAPYLRGEPGPVEPRFAGWLSAWELFLDHPLVGTGLGSFGRAIHLTQSVDVPDELWYVHCEPLNVLCDVGIVGFALLLAWLLPLAWRGRRAVRSSELTTALLAAGAAGAAVAALVAGLGDFPTQFPPVALPFAALLAVPAGLAAGPGGSATTEGAPGRVLRLLAATLLGMAAVLPAAAFAKRVGHVADGHEPGTSRGERLLIRAQAALRRLPEARTPAAAIGLARSATDTLAVAATDEPFLDATHLWEGLGHLTVLQLSTDPDEVERRRDAALRAFARAREVSRGHADVNLQIGLLYLDLLGTEPNPHSDPADTGMDALREAGALRPQAFSRAWQEALRRELPPVALERIVPARAHAERVWARHLRTLGRFDEAEAIVRRLDSEAVRDR